MIPPAPTVNDAIGLLVAISDPEKTKAVLEEVKKHSDTATEALTKAQAATKELEVWRRDHAAVAEKLGQERGVFVEDKRRFDADKKAYESSVAEINRQIAQRQQELDRRVAEISKVMNGFKDRERAIETREKELEGRTRGLDDREHIVRDLEDTLKPLLVRLK